VQLFSSDLGVVNPDVPFDQKFVLQGVREIDVSVMSTSTEKKQVILSCIDLETKSKIAS